MQPSYCVDTKISEKNINLCIAIANNVAMKIASKYGKIAQSKKSLYEDDFESDALLALYECIKRDKEISVPYAYKVAYRACNDTRRRFYAKKRRSLGSVSIFDEAVDEQYFSPTAITSNADLALSGSIAVEEMLKGLSASERELVIQRVIEEKSIPEIARSRGENRAKIQREYNQIIEKLRSEMI